MYWRFYDPSYLFVAGGGYAVNTTHRVGVFLLPIMFCLAIGINQIVNVRRSWITLLILCGFLTAPLAASVVGEPYAVQRELLVLPFAILIATIGVEWFIFGEAQDDENRRLVPPRGGSRAVRRVLRGLFHGLSGAIRVCLQREPAGGDGSPDRPLAERGSARACT